MVSRKTPMPRRSGATGAAPRAVSRPGVSSGDGGAANFQSPFQPPLGTADLSADVAMMDPNAWHVAHVGGRFWRVKVPNPSALGLLSEILERKGGSQVQAINMFLAAHMHPDDLAAMLKSMTDPDDPFGSHEYQELYRATLTMGTARPFWPCSD